MQTRIDNLVKWIRTQVPEGGKAILGISGGKDSTIAAALCVRALGKENVVGVMMPNGVQPDIDDSIKVCEALDIRNVTINIAGAYDSLMAELKEKMEEVTSQSIQNLPPRLRMSTLYAVSQCVNGRVANTCNLSEDWVGYSTRYGDSAGDVSLLGKLTVQEVKALGHELGLPEKLVEKTPSDGLCGSTDEQKLGFTYAVLDRYIRDGVCEDKSVRRHIDTLHKQNKFKLELIPTFEP